MGHREYILDVRNGIESNMQENEEHVLRVVCAVVLFINLGWSHISSECQKRNKCGCNPVTFLLILTAFP